MYYRQQINVTPKVVRLSEKTAVNFSTLIKFDRSNKFDLCNYMGK